MVVSTRAIAAVGLSALGLAVLVGPTLGQQQDSAVRKAASQGAAPSPSAPGPKLQPPTPATIGCVDMAAVFKEYDKVKVNSEEFRGAVMAKKGELTRVQAEAEQEAQKLAKMTPGSLDFKKIEDHITQLKAQFEAMREQCEREFTLKEAEMLATLYKEIQSMVSRVAQFKGFAYIVRVSNDPITGSNPNSAMMAIERTIVYADPRNDITKEVVYHLNREYKAAGGPAPKGSTSPSPTGNGNGTPSAPAGAGAPSGN
jgi:outer membrane protein